jgi:ABC-type polysaccharide/polyol phosphate export permease
MHKLLDRTPVEGRSPGWQMPPHFVASILYLARTTLHQRYCGSVLGFGWSLLNPLVTIGIYYLAFAVFIRVPIDNFFVYLSSGLIPWLFLSASLTVSTASLSTRTHALNTSIVNRLIFIFADTTIELITFAISLAALFLVTALLAEPPDFLWLLLPVMMLPLVVFCYAAAVCFAYYAVIYRDLAHLLQAALTVAFWLMPIVYHWSMVPAPVDQVVKYNPIAILIAPIQILLHGHQLPSLALFGAATGVAALAVGAAASSYRKRDREIIFYL